MHQSAEIGKLATALAKAQGEMGGAAKDAKNPHFNSRYADLQAVVDACKPLAAVGLAVLQPVKAEGAKVTVTTLLAHESGEWISEDLTMTAKDASPQAVGSAITYGRRYGLLAMVGLAPEDDDGNAAQPTKPSAPPRPAAKPAPAAATTATPSAMPEGFAGWWADLEATADTGLVALTQAFDASAPTLKSYLLATHAKPWAALKTRAAKVRP
jgi:hypothetical protein